MNKIILPAVCKRCGKAFFFTPSPFRLVNDSFPENIREQFFPNSCPNIECRGDVIIPAGIYEWTGNQIRLVEGSDYTKRVFEQAIEDGKSHLLLFRYMNHEFVEKFRNEGTLRVCPLTNYQSIQDIRQDETEGIQISNLKGSGQLSSAQTKSLLGINAQRAIFGPGCAENIKLSQALPKAYILATSTTHSVDLMNRFECDDYFVISNILAFKKALERAISTQIEVKHQIDQHIEYTINKEQHISIEQIMETDGTKTQIDTMSYFRKSIDYAKESEYRFLYIVESEDPLKELNIELTPEEIKASCQFRTENEWISSNYPNVGRNDLCPCGSKKKYKRCHGKSNTFNSAYYQQFS